MNRAYLTAIAGSSIVAAVLGIYLPIAHAPFIQEDLPATLGNVSLRHGFWAAVLDTWAGGRMVMGRPVLNLSFALNYELGGVSVVGYHAVNVLIHAAGALTLFGIIRRCFKNDLLLAWACALIWAVHPLQTSAVSYTVERAESLEGLFSLLSLYGFIRGAEESSGAPARAFGWFAGSALGCWLGMGTNEIMISIPFVLMLFDRTFLCPSWKEVARRRWVWHTLYLTSILWLYWLAGTSHNRGGSYGFGIVSWWKYAGAQYPAFATYLRLTIWPSGLVLDYGNRYLTSGWQIIPGAPLFLAFTLVALTTFYRPTAMSFLAVAFLEILEPTSVVPYRYETTAEHRMYLALAPLLFGGLWLIKRAMVGRKERPRGRMAFGFLVAAAAIALGSVTVLRNLEYRSGAVAAEPPGK